MKQDDPVHPTSWIGLGRDEMKIYIAAVSAFAATALYPFVVSGLTVNKDADFDCDVGCELSHDVSGTPVCGSDGITYYNECLAYCQGVEVVDRSGECRGDKPIAKDDASYYHDGLISKEILQRFSNDKYKLVAKRRFIDSPPKEPVIDPMDAKRFVGTTASTRAVRVTMGGYEYISEPMKIPEDPKVYVDQTGYNPWPANDNKYKYYDLKDYGEAGYGDEDGDDGHGYHHDRNLRRRAKVIGQDTRYQISRTDQWPYSTYGQLLHSSEDTDSGYSCTGTVISPTSVVTAAHCVWSQYDDAWHGLHSYVPGRRDLYTSPYGSFEIDYVTTYEEYKNGDWRYDMAVLTLIQKDDRYISDYVGYAGFAHTTLKSPDLQKTQIVAYTDADKAFGTMWSTGSCPSTFQGNGDGFTVFHQCDTQSGATGGALVDPMTNYVHGVHYGTTEGKIPYNVGLVLNEVHYYSLWNWSGRGKVGDVRNHYDWNQCMDWHPGTQDVYMFECHGGPDQTFYYDPHTKNIKSMKDSSYCLDYNQDNGDVFMYPCDDKRKSQHWSYNMDSKEVRNDYDDKCLDYRYSKGDVYVQSCVGKENQEFELPVFDF